LQIQKLDLLLERRGVQWAGQPIGSKSTRFLLGYPTQPKVKMCSGNRTRDPDFYLTTPTFLNP